MRYQNILFDLYGTLVDIHTDEDKDSAWKEMAGLYGQAGAQYSPEELKTSFRRFIREEEKEREEIRIERVFRRLFAEKGIIPNEYTVSHVCRTFRSLTTEYIRLYPGTLELLAALKDQGRRLFLLTNAQRVFTAQELQILGVEPYFEKIFISSDYGVKKPNVRFYQALLEGCRLKPQECLMIGNDEICDAGGGQNAGLDTIYLHTNLSPEYTGEVQADWMQMEPLEDMREVLRVIQRLEERR